MKKQQGDESRLDRIEKGLELLLHGTLELRESQKKTDEQILQLRESQKKTDEQILGLKEAQDRTEEHLNSTIEKLDEIGRQLGDLGLV